MQDKHLLHLEKLGLFRAEAKIYLALLRHSEPMRASAIVAATRVPRGSIYSALNRLTNLGLVEAEAGYGGRFLAVAAENALPSLLAREREELSLREKGVADLAQQLDGLTKANVHFGEAEVIQILRDPRVITERFERLQLEAKRQIEVCVKAPFFMGPVANTAQEKALRRGIWGRGLYEAAVLEAPEVRPYLETWIGKGEEARIYPGELPHKLALFDRQTVLLPLFLPGKQVRTLFIRHQPLATSLGLLFDALWDKSEPLILRQSRSRPPAGPPPRKIGNSRRAIPPNGVHPLSPPRRRKKSKSPRGNK